MKNKILKIATSLILITALMFNLLSMTVSTTDLTKISTYLFEKMNENLTETHPVSIWLMSPDIAVQQAALKTEVAAINENVNVELSSTKVYRQEMLDKIRTNYRTAITELYSKNNEAFVSSCIDKNDIVFISRYAPMIIANLTNDEIRNLTRSSDVVSLDYHIELEFEPNDDIPVTKNFISELDNDFEAMANYLSNYTGEGIKIGVMDTAFPIQSAISNCNIGGYSETYNDGKTDNHCTWVTQTILQYAPDSTYYFARVPTNGSSGVLIYELVEWLIGEGVNVINMSMTNELSTDFSTYNNYAKWFDHIAYTHYIPVIKSAGNNQQSIGKKGITTPGMAYNIITVGAMRTQNDMDSASSYYSGTVLASKPDICADTYAYADLDVGTSYSAAHITGMIALMLTFDSQLEFSPELIKAILTAAVNPNGARFVPAVRLATGISYMQAGAGFANLTHTITVTNNRQSRCSSLNPTQQEYNIPLVITTDNIGLTYRISMAYTIPAECIGTHTSGNTDISPIPNLDLAICQPNSMTPFKSSATMYNNVEILEFTPQIAGTYTIKVIQTTPSTNTTYWGVAWNVFN